MISFIYGTYRGMLMLFYANIIYVNGNNNNWILWKLSCAYWNNNNNICSRCWGFRRFADYMEDETQAAREKFRHKKTTSRYNFHSQSILNKKLNTSSNNLKLYLNVTFDLIFPIVSCLIFSLSHWFHLSHSWFHAPS